MSADSYVPVREEPRHRHSFENDYARVYDVQIPKGDTTLYHEHTEDTLYVSIAPASTLDQTLGEDKNPIKVPAGIAICRPHRNEPLIHRISNVGDNDMRLIGVEVKQSPPQVSQAPLEAAHHKLYWETERLRAYKLTLEAGASTDLIEYGFSGVTILLEPACLTISDAAGSERTCSLQAADVIWHDGPVRQTITNTGTTSCQAIVAEWR